MFLPYLVSRLLHYAAKPIELAWYGKIVVALISL